MHLHDSRIIRNTWNIVNNSNILNIRATEQDVVEDFLLWWNSELCISILSSIRANYFISIHRGKKMETNIKNTWKKKNKKQALYTKMCNEGTCTCWTTNGRYKHTMNHCTVNNNYSHWIQSGRCFTVFFCSDAKMWSAPFKSHCKHQFFFSPSRFTPQIQCTLYDYLWSDITTAHRYSNKATNKNPYVPNAERWKKKPHAKTNRQTFD